jgi:hypothetical protein
MNRTKKRLIALLSVLALAMSACGGNGGESTTEETPVEEQKPAEEQKDENSSY